jgi:hypothetical protein
VTQPRPQLFLLVATVLALALLGASITGASARPTRVTAAVATLTVSTSGRIGALQLGSSTQANVVAALGAPEAEGEGNFVGPSTPNYKGLGYECSAQQSAELGPVGNEGPPCRTVYYLDTATGVLGGLSTTSTRYATSHGTRVGTTEQRAASRERRPAIAGCQSGISELTRNTFLYISIRGGKIRKPSGSNQPLRIVGGRVDNIAVESRHDPVGVLFC